MDSQFPALSKLLNSKVPDDKNDSVLVMGDVSIDVVTGGGEGNDNNDDGGESDGDNDGD